MDIAVVGMGSWGTALTILLARNGFDVGLFGRDDEELEFMRSHRENARYLPGFAIPKIATFHHVSELKACGMTILAVPSAAVREVASALPGEHPILVLASKGIEATTGYLMSEVLQEVHPSSKIGILSGPNLAVEIVQGIPTAAIAASLDESVADRIRSAFMCSTYRVYASEDVVGVEVAGALKNVLAIGGGIADGLGFGNNTKGSLLARGLKEMIALGLTMGGKLETFLGIAGVGDLFATASSQLSRNYRVGFHIGQGMELGEVLEQLGQVAEGVGTADAAMMLSRKHNVPMPVFEAIDSVIRGRLGARKAVGLLMERMTRDEGLVFSPKTE